MKIDERSFEDYIDEEYRIVVGHFIKKNEILSANPFAKVSLITDEKISGDKIIIDISSVCKEAAKNKLYEESRSIVILLFLTKELIHMEKPVYLNLKSKVVVDNDRCGGMCTFVSHSPELVDDFLTESRGKTNNLEKICKRHHKDSLDSFLYAMNQFSVLDSSIIGSAIKNNLPKKPEDILKEVEESIPSQVDDFINSFTGETYRDVINKIKKMSIDIKSFSNPVKETELTKRIIFLAITKLEQEATNQKINN